MRLHILQCALLGLTLVSCECGPDPAPLEKEQPPGDEGSAQPHADPAPEPTGVGSGGEPARAELRNAAGGVRWDAPPPFEARPPSSKMRIAEYIVPERKEGESPATLRVFHFRKGGSTKDNVDRWLRQFDPPDGKSRKEVAKVREREVSGLDVTVVDMRGTFQPMQMPGRPSSGPRRNQRMLGAIIDAPQGRVFFKLVGDEAVVSHAEEAFRQLIDSLEAT